MMGRVMFAVVGSVSLLSASAPRLADAQELRDAPSAVDLASRLDVRFADRWRDEKIEPPALVDDATFLRRAHLDLVGTIPSVAQARDFLEDSAVDKREKLVDRLVTEPRSARHFARIWRRVMAPPDSPGAMGAAQLETWLEQQFAKNVPYDEFARQLVTAKGPSSSASATPVAFYQVVGSEPDNLATAFGRVFLGVRIGCAECHNHPFASWKQEDFWGLAAFFSGINEAGRPGAPIVAGKLAKIKPPQGNVEYAAKFLWDTSAEIPTNADPRVVLADWMVSPQNPNFAATAVNRFWQHLNGKGMVEHVDDLELVSSEERAVALDGLAREFAEARYDMRWLIRGICRSKIYQRESAVSFSEDQLPADLRRPLKTLTPDQVFDSLEQALSLPISRGGDSPRYNGQKDRLIARFNESLGGSPDEYRAGVPQALLMINGALVTNATDLEQSRTLRAVVDAPFLEPAGRIEALYLATLTRLPTPKESETLLQHVNDQPDESGRRQAYGEIFWALLNSPEFVLSR